MRAFFVLGFLLVGTAYAQGLGPKSRVESLVSARRSFLKDIATASGKYYILMAQESCGPCLRQLHLMQKCPEVIKEMLFVLVDGSKRGGLKKYRRFLPKEAMFWWPFKSETPTHTVIDQKANPLWKFSGVLSCEKLVKKIKKFKPLSS